MTIQEFAQILPEKVCLNLADKPVVELTDWQEKIVKKFKQGSDFVGLTANPESAIWPLILGSVFRSPDSYEGSPRVLIFTDTNDRALELKKYFDSTIFRSGITLEMANDKGKMIEQRNQIFDGADIILGNPKRIFDLYIQNGINLGEIKLCIFDQVDNYPKMVPHLIRIADSLPKSQRVFFIRDWSEKIENLADEALNNPAEISE